MRLALKMGFSLIVLVAIALGLVHALNYYKYKTLLRSLVRSRMEVVTLNIQNSVQSALHLGLSLADTRTTSNLIEIAKAQDPTILSITAFEALPSGGGRILYDTNEASVGKTPDPAWLAAIHHPGAEGSTWLVSNDTATVIGASLVDRLEQPIGGIALSYDSNYERARLDQMSKRLLSSALEVLAGAVVLSVILMILFFLPISARFRVMGEAVEAAAAGNAPPLAGIDPTFPAFGENIHAAHVALAQAEQVAESIEHAGNRA